MSSVNKPPRRSPPYYHGTCPRAETSRGRVSTKKRLSNADFGRVVSEGNIEAYLDIWRKTPDGQVAKFSAEMVEDIYRHLYLKGFPLNDIKALEFSGLLEKYLWYHLYEGIGSDMNAMAATTSVPGKSSSISTAIKAAEKAVEENEMVAAMDSIQSNEGGNTIEGFEDEQEQQKKDAKVKATEDDILKDIMVDDVDMRDVDDDEEESIYIPIGQLNTRRSLITRSHCMLIVLMFLEKFRDNLEGWHAVDLSDSRFEIFFEIFLNQVNPEQKLKDKKQKLTKREYSYYLQFLTNCFNSYEEVAIRNVILQLVAVPSWLHLSQNQLEEALRGITKQDTLYKKVWKSVKKKYAIATGGASQPAIEDKKKKKEQAPLTRLQIHARDFMWSLIADFFEMLDEQRNAPLSHALPPYFLHYVERFLELIIDLLSQLPLRKCFRPLFLDKHFVVRVRDFIELMRIRAKKQDELIEKKAQSKGRRYQPGSFGRFVQQQQGSHHRAWTGKSEIALARMWGKDGKGGTPAIKGNYGKDNKGGGKSPKGGKKGYGTSSFQGRPTFQSGYGSNPAMDNQGGFDNFGGGFVPNHGGNQKKKGGNQFGENQNQCLQVTNSRGNPDFEGIGQTNIFVTNNSFDEQQAERARMHGFDLEQMYGQVIDDDTKALMDMLLGTNEKDDGLPLFTTTESAGDYSADVWIPDDITPMGAHEEERFGWNHAVTRPIMGAQYAGGKGGENIPHRGRFDKSRDDTAATMTVSTQATTTGSLEDKSEQIIFATGIYDHDDMYKLSDQLLDIISFYEHFEVENFTGIALTSQDKMQEYYDQHNRLRKICFAMATEDEEIKTRLQKIALSHVGEIETKSELEKIFIKLPYDILQKLVHELCFLDVKNESVFRYITDKLAVARKHEQGPEMTYMRNIFLKVLLNKLEKKPSQREKINALPLFPTEELIWDRNRVPDEHYQSEYALALPKLNLQFLTIHDYLLRNFHLFRLESTYSIRENIRDLIPRMRPIADINMDTGVRFGGSARMATECDHFKITEIQTPLVGETVPSMVRCEIKFNLDGIRSENVRSEWDALREHDIMFLITLDSNALAKLGPQGVYWGNPSDLTAAEFPKEFGIKQIRGVEVHSLLDEENNVISDPVEKKTAVGTVRTVKAFYDPAQYDQDKKTGFLLDADDSGHTFNVVMRRQPKENNFKAVLETIRSLMESQEQVVVPKWLHKLFLGYGDPKDAQCRILEGVHEIDFRDTFLDRKHVYDSFPEAISIHVPESMKPPYKLNFESETIAATTDNTKDEPSRKLIDKKVIGSTYVVKNPGPYEHCLPNLNKVRFTPVQIDAIRSGVSEGLTMVVGPPGTGKTDTAVQIVNLLFHNYPEQRIVLVAHSNQALNDLFQKIVRLDIPERYLVRLGRGIDELDSEKDFSKHGRIDFMLKRRLELLKLVEKLAISLGLDGENESFTCENAKYFFLQHVQFVWELFLEKLKIAGKNGEKLWEVVQRPVKVEKNKQQYDNNQPSKKKRKVQVSAADKMEEKKKVAATEEDKKSYAEELMSIHKGSVVGALFPYTGFFDDVFPLFHGKSYEEDLDIAEGCFRYLKTVWKEIEECTPFELLRNGTDRGNYLITKHARIVAMTCTHAALTRKNLVNLNFKYDSLIMEEAGQILEVETLIPMLLQRGSEGTDSRLKRVCLIGDHHQLPPVVKNRAFQKFGHLDQSLFTRFIRLNVPHLTLNAQGRARPSIAALYSWRYKTMHNLPKVLKTLDYKLANTGFIYDYQFINVGRYNGNGETEPTPFFYQNEGEAEYAVALFMLMRLMGYPGGNITILTTYNGQKALIRDVLQKRCSWNPIYGWPKQITTVDKYQGQQNEHIILSLVRTSAVGHLRDVRRLVVAMSRSKLGLYVLGDFQNFAGCFELKTVMDMFKKRPLELVLYKGFHEEFWPSERFLNTSDEYVQVHSRMVPGNVEDLWKIVGELTSAKRGAIESTDTNLQEPEDDE